MQAVEAIELELGCNSILLTENSRIVGFGTIMDSAGSHTLQLYVLMNRRNDNKERRHFVVAIEDEPVDDEYIYISTTQYDVDVKTDYIAQLLHEKACASGCPITHKTGNVHLFEIPRIRQDVPIKI